MPHKSIRNLLLEILLLATMVALTGHVTVNFWERYVVQNELSNIKNSLNYLKGTVHKIGDVYDNLQREVIDLTRINAKPSVPSHEFSSKKTLDQRILQNLEVLLMKINDAHPLKTSDKDSENMHKTDNLSVRSATTITRYPTKATAVGSESIAVSNKSECLHNYNKRGNNEHKSNEDFYNWHCAHQFKHLKL